MPRDLAGLADCVEAADGSIMTGDPASRDFKSSCLDLPKYAATLDASSGNSLKTGNPMPFTQA
jgi:hypothetical protein